MTLQYVRYNFDYRYGVVKEHRDLNNFYYETDVDDLGRITGVRGPNELATCVPYAIAFEYQPLATFEENGITAPAHAVTKHYDIQHPNDDLETVTFVDGFGRTVQVKKDGVVTAVLAVRLPPRLSMTAYSVLSVLLIRRAMLPHLLTTWATAALR